MFAASLYCSAKGSRSTSRIVRSAHAFVTPEPASTPKSTTSPVVGSTTTLRSWIIRLRSSACNASA